MERAPRISFTSLGCPKALVDSERIITRLRAEGYELARRHDVYLGCNCPTARQPDVLRCHTVLALAFLRERYPDLSVRLP